jgi:acyl carrier protein
MSITVESVVEFLKNAVMDLKDIEPEDLSMDTELESIQLESLDYVDIQVNIQKTYKVAILSDLFVSRQVTTIGQLAAYIVAEVTKLASAQEVTA